MLTWDKSGVSSALGLPLRLWLRMHYNPASLSGQFCFPLFSFFYRWWFPHRLWHAKLRLRVCSRRTHLQQVANNRLLAFCLDWLNLLYVLLLTKNSISNYSSSPNHQKIYPDTSLLKHPCSYMSLILYYIVLFDFNAIQIGHLSTTSDTVPS